MVELPKHLDSKCSQEKVFVANFVHLGMWERKLGDEIADQIEHINNWNPSEKILFLNLIVIFVIMTFANKKRNWEKSWKTFRKIIF